MTTTTNEGQGRVLAALSDALGADRIATDAEVLARHRQDWSGEPGETPAAVIRPRNAEEVSSFLRLCHEHSQPVAVQGGLTGLCGAACVKPGELALSLSRLNAIDIADGAMIVGAGVTVEEAQKAARDAGFELGIDFGARGTATIGGAIGTNAGGLHVIESGMTRAQVLGLEVVLADGRVISELTPMVKVNTGFDLKHLFIGSEGTLSVVTRACLALRPLREGLSMAVIALAAEDALVPVLTAAKRTFGPDLSAFEAMWPEFVHTMRARTHFTMPIDGPLLAIIEVRDGTNEGAQRKMEALLSAEMERGTVADGIIAQSHSQARSLWAMRDEGPATYHQVFADNIGFDVSVPLSRMVEAVHKIAAHTRSRAGFHPMFYGHIGDQNLHVVVGADEKFTKAQSDAIKDSVYEPVVALGGTISAEHGIG
ncbi:MAG: FAD-binding oxidoreductase, partial [Pseudomonadota bacterium]